MPQPRGFCAGVVRAIDIVRLALQRFGAPVYVRKEIVHNRHVVAELAAEGAVFVDGLDLVPDGAVVVFSAHGVSPEVRADAARRHMHVIDATCPLVAKVHLEALRFAREGYTVVLIGHRGHDEVVGTVGEAPEVIQVIGSAAEVDGVVVADPRRVAYLTQTTLSVDDTSEVVDRLKARFPDLVAPPDQDICYATQNRQTAVKIIAGRAEVILVVGARNSSNSNRLVEVARRAGTRAYLVESAKDIQPEWIASCSRIGVTAGASTPERLVGQVVEYLNGHARFLVEELTIVDEDVRFSLPREVRDPGSASSAAHGGSNIRARVADHRGAAIEETVGERLSTGIDASTSWLVDQQAPEGYWCGELRADTTLASDYILYLHVLGDTTRVPKLAAHVRRHQLPDGGWNIYEGGPSELNATVKAYLALRLAGDAADAPNLARARRRVHGLGGLERTNSFTRFYLALIGALDWTLVPAMPPELVIVPSWFVLNLYEMSSWTRAIVVPLTILYALKPKQTILPGARVDELFRDPSGSGGALSWDATLFSLRNLFLVLDRVARLHERLPWKPLRRRALKEARRWLLEHLERSGGLAAIYPAMMNVVFALLAMGESPTSPLVAREIEELAKFEIEDDETLRLQPCMSPVWDTAIAMVALQQAGLPSDHPALVKAADWLLDQQICGAGDWQVKNPGVEPGGWSFEFQNEFYPDLDDTAFVLIALRGVRHPDRARMDAAVARAVAWLASMQNRDGGWGAFDRDNDAAALTAVPFADHNAMIDPSTADVTARVIECLAHCGRRADDPAIVRALDFLRREQEPDGSWYGRWGVNYIYGTSGVLRAAAALGVTDWECCRRAAAWLRSVQHTDGGFGETCASYDDPAQKGRGPSTASQTAWALIGLLAVGLESDPATAMAVDYLLKSQDASGTWDEQATTGTGFPRVFYLKYDLYRHSFPLYALALYRDRIAAADERISA
jgi:squalene-hopene/tetraprenyl-beta-curcumene cyclase